MHTSQSPLFHLLSDSQLLEIETLSDCILKEVGVNLLGDPQILDMLRSVGAIVNDQNVRIDAQTLRAIISHSAPQTFTWKSADKSLHIARGHPIFTPMFGAPNIRRQDQSYGLTTFNDYEMLVKRYQQSPLIDASGYLLCIAHDIEESKRPIAMAKAHLEHSNKPMMGTILSPTALNDVAQLAKATEFVAGECQLLHMINSTPPLTYQPNPLQCLRRASQLGQGCLVSSYMMMGATSTVSVKASLAQGLAEILIGLALTQIYQPGSCVAGGLFATPFSMSKMLPAFGTVESQVAQIAAVQLIKRLGIPSRGDGFITSAKISDDQAQQEGSNIMSASIYAGADLILHTAGWLENGRCIDRLKIDRDLDLLQRFDTKIRS